jgi:hypothetical protein
MDRDVRRAIWRAAEILATEDDFLASQPELAAMSNALTVATLQSLPLAMQRRLVHKWLISQSVGNVGFDEVGSVLRLLKTRTAKVNLPGGKCARRREKRIFIDEQ